MATSTLASASSPASINPVGPLSAMTTAWSVMRASSGIGVCQVPSLRRIDQRTIRVFGCSERGVRPENTQRWSEMSNLLSILALSYCLLVFRLLGCEQSEEPVYRSDRAADFSKAKALKAIEASRR